MGDEVKFTLRLTAEQNEIAERMAREEGISKNAYIARLIEVGSDGILTTEKQNEFAQELADVMINRVVEVVVKKTLEAMIGTTIEAFAKQSEKKEETPASTD